MEQFDTKPEHTITPGETGLSSQDIGEIEKMFKEKIIATTKIKGKFDWEITFSFYTLADLTENLAKIETALAGALGLEEPLPWEGDGEPTPSDTVQPVKTPVVVRTIQETPAGEHPVCPIHNQPMDKRTVRGDAYHTFNHRNCSGEGWWGEPRGE